MLLRSLQLLAPLIDRQFRSSWLVVVNAILDRRSAPMSSLASVKREQLVVDCLAELVCVLLIFKSPLPMTLPCESGFSHITCHMGVE